MNKRIFLLWVLFSVVAEVSTAQVLNGWKPRILISSDIGGTDPDDN